MRKLFFTQRCLKELLRDPLSIFFGGAFPVILLLLLTLIQSNIPVSLFELESLTPGIVVFGFSFLSLFGATRVSADRSSAFLTRLYASPMNSGDFLFGYGVSLVPVALLQAVICFFAAMLLGLSFSPTIFLCIAICLPCAVLYISLGLLLGSLLTEKQVGGICGALLTNLSAWLSGIWFDLDLMGNTVKNIAYSLPFANAVEAARAALAGNCSDILRPLLIVCIYAAGSFLAAVIVFRRKMKN